MPTIAQSIEEHMAAGQFDQEIAELVRDPEYRDCTARDIKTIIIARAMHALQPSDEEAPHG